MSDQKPEGNGTKHAPVAKMDPEQPFFIVLTQTESRNVITLHQGKEPGDALNAAKAEASRRAVSSKVPAYVLGPQRLVFQPPKEPTVEEVQTAFNI